MAGTVCLSAGCPPMEHLLKSATSADYEGAGPYAGEGANVCFQ
jgi:hypothetical protein